MNDIVLLLSLLYDIRKLKPIGYFRCTYMYKIGNKLEFTLQTKDKGQKRQLRAYIKDYM